MTEETDLSDFLYWLYCQFRKCGCSAEGLNNPEFETLYRMEGQFDSRKSQ
jgi:hypothetical protein